MGHFHAPPAPIYHTHHCDNIQYCNVNYSSQASNTATFSILILSSAAAGAAVSLPHSPRCSLPARSQSQHHVNSVHNGQATSTSIQLYSKFNYILCQRVSQRRNPDAKTGRAAAAALYSSPSSLYTGTGRDTGRISYVPAARTTHAA